MPPYEVDSGIANLVKVWIKKRAHKLKEYVDQNLQQEDTFNSFFGTYLMNFSLVKSGCRNSFIPPLPALTRCEIGSKPRKKKEKLQDMPKRKSQVGSTNGDGYYGLSQLCIRIRVNSLNYIWTVGEPRKENYNLYEEC
ncbi:unnamed protein product [Musa hybrid cultivar]